MSESTVSTLLKTVPDFLGSTSTWKKYAGGLVIAGGIGSLIFAYKFKAREHESIPPLEGIGWDFFTGNHNYISNLRKNDPNWRYTLANLHIEQCDKKVMSSARLGLNVIYLNDPEIIKYVFETKFMNFKRGFNNLKETLEELLGEGIFLSDPPEWKMHRKVELK